MSQKMEHSLFTNAAMHTTLPFKIIQDTSDPIVPGCEVVAARCPPRRWLTAYLGSLPSRFLMPPWDDEPICSLVNGYSPSGDSLPSSRPLT